MYVNGELVGQSGSLNAYKPKYRIWFWSFRSRKNRDHPANCQQQPLLQRSLLSPAIGTAQTIHKMISSRLVFYGFSVSQLWRQPYTACPFGFSKKRYPKPAAPVPGYPGIFFLHPGALPIFKIVRCPSGWPSVCSGRYLHLCGNLCRAENLYPHRAVSTPLGASAWFFPVALGMCVCQEPPACCFLILPAFTSYYGFIISWYKLAYHRLVSHCSLHLWRVLKSQEASGF